MLAACSGSTAEPKSEGRLLVLAEDGAITVLERSGRLITELRGPAENLVVQQPTWSPSGAAAVWTEVGPDSAVIATWDGKATETVGSPIAPFFYLWNPTGRQVAFLGSSSTGLRLGLLDVEAHTVTEIDAGQPYYLDWDPDGSRLVTHVGNEKLSVLKPDGSLAEVSVVPGLFQAPDWLSGGEVLVVGAGTSGGVAAANAGRLVALRQEQDVDRLLLLDPDEGVSRELATVSGLVSFGASPDGSKVAFTQTEGVALGSLQVLSVDGGESQQLASDAVAAFQWSPAGDQVWYLTIDIEASLLVPHVWQSNRTLDFPGFLPTQVFGRDYLQFWDQYTRSLTLWSPDGAAFVYAASGGERDGIFVQPVAPGTGPTRISDGVFASFSPT